MTKFYLGLDLGGTNVKAGIVDQHGQVIAQVSRPTAGSAGKLTAKSVIRTMLEAGEQAIAKSGIPRRYLLAAGVLSPGQASLKRGIVLRSANLPLWRNVPLRREVSQGLKLPAILENDAKAAAYGEWWAGAGTSRRPESLFMFTLGTGVGGGWIYQGRVVHGSFDYATEVGHWIMIPGGELCGCGQHGCLERYCSATYTARRASTALAASKGLCRRSSLGQIFRKDGLVTSADIVDQAKKGDAFALEVWDETCRILALACINVCHFADPEMIVLGGGMSQAGRFLLDRVQRHFKANWWKMTRPTARITLARLGNDAGVIGAAGVAKEAADRGTLAPLGQ